MKEVYFNNLQYLWGLSALVPLFILHWYRFKIKDSIPFSTLFLFQDLNSKLPSVRHLNLWQFLLHALIVISLVALFIKPEIHHWEEKPQTIHYHILDCSASMNTETQRNQLLHSLNRNLQSDKVQHKLVYWQGQLEIVQQNDLPNLLSSSFGQLDYIQLTEWIKEITLNANNEKQTVHFNIYSDYTGPEWTEFLVNSKNTTLSHYPIYLEQITSSREQNIRISQIEWQRSKENPSLIKLSVECQNQSNLAQYFGVHCHTNINKSQRMDTLLGAYSKKRIEFTFNSNEEHYIQGHAYIDFQDNFILDNKMYFVIPSKPSLSVWKSPSNLENNNIFLDQFIGSMPWIHFQPIRWDQLLTNPPDLLILSADDLNDSDNYELLQAYLTLGRSVLYIPDATATIPAMIQKLIEIDKPEYRNYSITSQPNQFSSNISPHPITRLLDNSEIDELLNARFLKWLEIPVGASPILAFKNNSTALSVRKINNSNIIFCAFKWNEEWSDWFQSSSYRSIMRGLFYWIEDMQHTQYNQSILDNLNSQISEPGIYLNPDHPVAWNIARSESDFSTNSFHLSHWTRSPTKTQKEHSRMNKDNFVLNEQIPLLPYIMLIFLILICVEIISYQRIYRKT